MFSTFTGTMKLEYFGEVSIYFGIGVQIVFALILGGLVGFDREIKLKAAGLKTNILICIGATLYTTISMINLHAAPDGALIDPNRLSAQIVSGIGFLGAGAIIQGRGMVTGLTTAATIWVVAAIGYTIGVGYPIVATLFSVTVLLVLKMINPLNKYIEKDKDHQLYQIELLASEHSAQTINQILKSEKISVLEIVEKMHHYRDNPAKMIDLYVSGHYRALERIGHDLDDCIKIYKTNFRPIDQLPSEFNKKV